MRAPGWTYEDPVILESQGQVSGLIVRSIDTLAVKRPALGTTLKQPGALLDVGTGVGWLAIEAARSWPALRVVGIDSWEAALILARKNLAQSDVAERVELRSQRVERSMTKKCSRWRGCRDPSLRQSPWPSRWSASIEHSRRAAGS